MMQRMVIDMGEAGQQILAQVKEKRHA